MKLNARISLLLVIVLLALPVMAACSGVSFKIDFMVDGEVYDTLDTNGSEVIELPPTPTKDGYEFDGWYWDDVTFTRPFTANSLLDAPLSSDMKVYAKMVEIGTKAVTPVPGTAYKLFVDQETAGVRIFINGNKDAYYLGTDTDINNALNVYVEDANIQGKYFVFAVKDGTRQYINIEKSGTMYNAVFSNAGITAYAYDATKKTLVATVDGNSLVLGVNTSVNYQRIGVRYLFESSYLVHFALSQNPDEVIPDASVVESNIAGVQSGGYGMYKSSGTVIGVNKQCFIIDDGTGKIVVFQGANWTPDVEIGDVVEVDGLTTVYSGSKQFGRESTYTVTGTAEVTYGTPKELTLNDLNAYNSMTNIVPELVKVKGVLELSGTYYNLIVSGTDMKPSITYPLSEDAAFLNSLAGKTVEVVGYSTSVTGGGIYISILALEINEAEADPDPTPTPTPTPDPDPATATPEEIVNAAYELAVGAQFNNTYTLTGVITSVNSAYSTEYQNVTVTIVVGNMTDKPIKCFRLGGDGADIIAVGDTITVSGTLTNYEGIIEFRQGCTLDSYVKDEVAPTPTEATVAEIISGELGLYVTSGTVVGINSRAFLVKDSTGIILVYIGGEHNFAVGDVVTVKGTTSVYGAAKQISSPEITKTGTAAVEHGTVTELGAAQIEAYVGMDNVAPLYVKVRATLSKSGNYYNLTFAGTDITGSVSYPLNTAELDALVGKEIEITGYAIYVTSSSSTGIKYLNILALDVAELEATDPDPDPVPTTAAISEVLAGELGLYTTSGVVAGYDERSMLLLDNGSYILVYLGQSWVCDVYLGNLVTVTGTTELSGGAKQFGLTSTYVITGNAEYTHPNPKVLSATELDAYKTAASVTPLYVEVTGIFGKDNGIYTLDVDGAQVKVRLSYPPVNLDQFIDVSTVVTGYVTGTENGGDYLVIMAALVESVEPEITTSDISSVIAGDLGDYQIEGTVVGINSRAFLVKDSTGIILVYIGGEHNFAVGDVVTIKGTTSVYGAAKQISSPEITKTGTAAVEHGAVTELGAAQIEAYVGMDNVAPLYVKVRATLSKSGNYYNLAFAGTDITGSVSYPLNTAELDALVGKEIEITGYAIYVTSSSSTGIKYLNILALDVAELEATDPDPDPTPTLDTPEKIVNAAYELASGASLEGTYTLTGVIITVDSVYNAQFGNVTVTIVVGDMTDKPIKCFRLGGDGADIIAVGDTVTVSGTLTNYQGTIEFAQGCTLDSYTEAEVAPTPTAATIAEVLTGELGLYTTSGTVVGINARSFLLGDNGSYILVYRGTSWTPDVEIGDVVTVTGTTTVYGGAMQFGDSASYEMTAGNGYTQPTAKEITTQELDAYRTVIVVTPEYIKITGVLTVSGNYYNVAVDGASITGSFTYPVADDAAALQALNGQTVELVGYTTGVTGGGNYLSIMVTEFCEASQN